MKNKEQELSIVIPCKNEEGHIGKLLMSLERQDYPIEKTKIFIADANSTDNTIKEIKRFLKSSLFPQQADGVLRSASGQKRQESKILERPKNSTPEFLVSLIAKSDDVADLLGIKPNLAIKKNKKLDIKIIKGGMPSVGRNNGAKLCKSRYILFIDGDIELDDKEIIKKSIGLMKKNKFCCVTANIKCKNGNFLENIIYSFNNLIQGCSKYISPYATGMYMMFERKKFFELGGFDEEIFYAEDYFLTKKLKCEEFGIAGGFVYTTNRRFKKIGHGKTIINFIKIAIKSGNKEYFYKDNGYWD